MQAPGTLNLTLPQGATWDVSLTWNDSDGLPVNLSGYTAAMQVRESYTDAVTVVSLTAGSGITLGGTAGTIGITVGAATTAGVAAGNYVYDLELVSGGGVVTRLVQGSVVVTPEVTR